MSKGLGQLSFTLAHDPISQEEGFIVTQVSTRAGQNLDAAIFYHVCDFDSCLDLVGAVFENKSGHYAVVIQILTLNVLAREQVRQRRRNLVLLVLDLVEVGRAVTLGAESWKFTSATEKDLSRLIATAVFRTYCTYAPFDSEEVFVSRARTFQLFFKQLSLFFL